MHPSLHQFDAPNRQKVCVSGRTATARQMTNSSDETTTTTMLYSRTALLWLNQSRPMLRPSLLQFDAPNRQKVFVSNSTATVRQMTPSSYETTRTMLYSRTALLWLNQIRPMLRPSLRQFDAPNQTALLLTMPRNLA